MKLMAGNLPANTTKEALHDYLAKFGECEITNIEVSSTQGTTANVTYTDDANALKAIDQSHGSTFGGNEIRLTKYESESHVSVPAEVKEAPAKASEGRSRSRSRSPPSKETREPASTSADRQSRKIEGAPTDSHGSPVKRAEPTPAKEVHAASPQKPADASPPAKREEHKTPVKAPEEPAEVHKEEEAPHEAPEEAKMDVDEPAEKEKGKKQSDKDITVEEDGSKFKILSTNKRNDELSSWKCLACNRKIQKKSVKSHIASKTHKQHIS